MAIQPERTRLLIEAFDFLAPFMTFPSQGMGVEPNRCDALISLTGMKLVNPGRYSTPIEMRLNLNAGQEYIRPNWSVKRREG
jgi:hypothetical protein